MNRKLNVLGMCIDVRVVAVLGLALLGLIVLAPKLALAALPIALVLICPLSMMFMMRGMNGSGMSGMNGHGQGADPSAQAQSGAARPTSRGQQIASLQADLSELEARNAELAHELKRLRGQQAVDRPTHVEP